MNRRHESETFPISAMRILIGSDNYRLFAPVQLALSQAGIQAEIASGYNQIENLWQRHRHEIVLVEVSTSHSVEAAVSIATRIKRHDARQFVGYLADPILRNHGLTGDGVFPRDSRHLPAALREFFGPQL
jgi:hypothetical protein